MASSFDYPAVNNSPLIEAALTADGDMSGELQVLDSDFNIAIWGTFVSTVQLQVKPAWRDVVADWITVQEYTEPALDTAWPMKGMYYVRAVISGHSSGTANVALYRGEDATKRVLMTKKYDQ